MNPENKFSPQENAEESDSRFSEAESKPKSLWKQTVKEIGLFLLIAVVVVLPFRIYIAEPYLVDGRSMDPTFATGDYLIVDKISYKIGTPKRNTVIVFQYPGDPKNDPSRSFLAKTFNPGSNFIKRIIGLPGETVVVKDNTVKIINKENPEGFMIDQSYVKHEVASSSVTILGPDQYFVMGDNRAESFDSRYWGPLDKKYLLGKPVIMLFGLKRYGIIPVPLITKFTFLPGNDTK